LRQRAIDLRIKGDEVCRLTLEREQLSNRQTPLHTTLAALLNDAYFKRKLMAGLHPDRLSNELSGHANVVRNALSL